ncbi:ribosome small subunit-dependent GTPase A [Mycoplasmoides genitalium]
MPDSNFGIVLQSLAKQCKVFWNNQIITAFPQKKLQWKNDFKLMVGDRVQLEDGAITKVLARKNELTRPRVANVDQIVLIQSLVQPKINWIQLLKLLVYFNAKLIDEIPILITKTDLDFDPMEKQKLIDLKQFNYQLFFVSKNEPLPSELIDIFSKKLSVFTGQSGVGKSSLINRLDPSLKQKIQALSVNKFGKNTTTKTTLFLFRGGFICDTPGFNVISIKNLKILAAQHFVGFQKMISKCHFSNCYHQYEKDCFVTTSVMKNRYPSWLYEKYRKMIN